MLLNKLIFICIIINCCAQLNVRFRNHPSVAKWKRRFLENTSKQICYDVVGCFDLPNKLSPLKKAPESPTLINTKFYLFRRNVPFSKPEVLQYEDNGLSINRTKFNSKDPLKVLIHGYMGTWMDDNSLYTVQLYLKIYDCNVILVDWEKGARGPQYTNAAANTEIVGKQLGILLLHMIHNGLNPKKLHLIGFSLGAHVAGCASEFLKVNTHLIGRITGLDAASPLFRHNNFKEKSKKLDKDDAVFVDAIHTDASPFFTEGFGLLEPIGHVDFFPNGGFQQPGCDDRRASVVMTHFEKTISKDTACSHLRSWELFIESLEMKLNKSENCQFTAFKCKNGLDSFQKGLCFSNLEGSKKSLLDNSYRTDLDKMGEDAEGNGIMYLVTRDRSPFCGKQLQVGVVLFTTAEATNGEIYMTIWQGTRKINVKMMSSSPKQNNERENYGLTIVDYDGFNIEEKLAVEIVYFNSESKVLNVTDSLALSINRVTVRDTNANSWSFCKNGTNLKNGKGTTFTLNPGKC
ncbi:hypothetical protein FQA39_LY04631 [Lamprigera yunnana]|nr:hypothetical protein FQA39_LY04631 [Lamprigera yunnana]